MSHFYRPPYLTALLAGLLAVPGFAPFNLFPLPVIALAWLFLLWEKIAPRAGFITGFLFGLGLFVGGIHWIFVALHEYGAMPLPLALLATLLLCAMLALFYALIGYTQARISVSRRVRFYLLLPALFVSGELVRGYFLTGFPWLSLGYSQLPDSPLRGYAPLLGGYGVSLAVALSAGGLAALWRAGRRNGIKPASALLACWLAGAWLASIHWTQPSGAPITISLLQGNIAQNEKFEETQRVNTLETYRRLIESSTAQLIVLPETALPLMRHQIPEHYFSRLQEHAAQNQGDVLIGSFEYENGAYFNSVYSLGLSPGQRYRKNHLVPFGEFIPARPIFGWFINEVLAIPMSDLQRGGERQATLNLAGQRIAINICYEDVFGEEIIRALPEASLLINVTNDAWYGHSHAAAQHNQIAQMRALETGRMLLRATNTGLTAIIGADGRIQQQLAQHEESILNGIAQGYSGSTPFVRWGNSAIALILLAMFLAVAVTFKMTRNPILGNPV